MDDTRSNGSAASGGPRTTATFVLDEVMRSFDPYQKAGYYAVCSHIYWTGGGFTDCTAGTVTLASEAGMGRPKLRAVLDGIVALGELVQVTVGGGRGNTAVYRLPPKRAAELAALLTKGSQEFQFRDQETGIDSMETGILSPQTGIDGAQTGIEKHSDQDFRPTIRRLVRRRPKEEEDREEEHPPIPPRGGGDVPMNSEGTSPGGWVPPGGRSPGGRPLDEHGVQMTRTEVRADIARWKHKQEKARSGQERAEEERRLTPEDRKRMQEQEEEWQRKQAERDQERQRQQEEKEHQEQERKAALAALKAKPMREWKGKDYDQYERLLHRK